MFLLSDNRVFVPLLFSNNSFCKQVVSEPDVDGGVAIVDFTVDNLRNLLFFITSAYFLYF